MEENKKVVFPELEIVTSHNSCRGCWGEQYHQLKTDCLLSRFVNDTHNINCELALVIFKKPEAKKIKTEYEWKKERCDLLGIQDIQDYTSEESYKDIMDEHYKLSKWIEENKPAKWVTCTRENTKVGNEIRFKPTGALRVVEAFYQYKHTHDRYDVLINDKEDTFSGVLCNHEINLNR